MRVMEEVSGKPGDRSDNWAELTPREGEVVELIAMDLTYEEIGERLCISKRTVESHAENLLRKLKTANRRELGRRARARGLGTGSGPAAGGEV